VLGTIELPGPPLRFDDLTYAGGRCEHLPPPGLGAHNESVRGWLDECDRVESTNEATGDQE
jgi:formyl-CoA transferase